MLLDASSCALSGFAALSGILDKPLQDSCRLTRVAWVEEPAGLIVSNNFRHPTDPRGQCRDSQFSSLQQNCRKGIKLG